MRYGIFSDIHSNLEAFKAVIEAYKKEGIDRYLCIGDIVGYAAEPAECIRLVKELKAQAVCGNHEWGVCAKYGLENFTPLAQEAVIWTARQLNPQELDFLGGLPLVYRGDDFVLAHSTLDEPEGFYYLNNYDEAASTFARLEKQLCFVGHTHRPGVFTETDFPSPFSRFERLELKADKRYIINVGSVGQPRDRDPRASFAVYDTEERTVEIKRIEYDIEVTRGKILKSRLPEDLAARLSDGR